MKPSDLLQAWAATRRRAEAWGAVFADDPTELVRVCGAALAAPQDPGAVVRALVNDGEFELAELLLLDEEFADSAGPALLATLEAEVTHARSVSLQEIEADLEFVLPRASSLGVPIDVAAIRSAGRRRADARRLLAEAERRVADAEEARVAAVLVRLRAVPQGESTPAAFESWQAAVRRALAMGDYEVVDAALAQGPTADLPPAIDVPEPIRWPYDGESVAELLRWFGGDRPSPPAFGRYLPHDDDAAQALLNAASRWSEWAGDPVEVDALLQAFAAVLDCKLVSEARPGGATHRLDDLSAPGFHAFGRSRWPDGIPVEFDGDGTFLVGVAGGALRLPLRTVLAVLHDRGGRRWRLLAELGRQVRLADAFPSLLPDESVRWERHDVTIPDAADAAVLLVAAPGMGVTTLLRELAAPLAGVVIDAPLEPELPEAPAIFLDRADRLGPTELRALVREIHWIRTTRQPAPRIVLAGRPELRAKLGPLPRDTFVTLALSGRSLPALREQARTTLAWVGIHATRPGIHDRMAWLASGNPTLLLLLCRAVARRLDETGGVSRRIDDDLVVAAWRSSELRHAARVLLWDPVLRNDGVSELIRAIVHLDLPGRPLRRDELGWLLEERDDAWIAARMDLLVDYGLVRRDADGERPWPGGLAQLVSHWTDE
ncbi:MAG: hypothetical protein JNL82_36000 [Myxococcales bacterium]|nr:hypothetical protein [Myxococcales bacterium]